MVDGNLSAPNRMETHRDAECVKGFDPDLSLWQSFTGIYKDPSNSDNHRVFNIRLQDGNLYIAKGDREVLCTAINDRCFLSEFGLIEFEDTLSDEVKVLVWGKATRYYPLDKDDYKFKRVIKYLVDIPVTSLSAT